MTAGPATVVSALAAAMRSAPGRPFVTMYDEATGERVELSVATFDNWVCKLANLFRAEWDIEPGERLSISLPAHWQSMAVSMAAWACGLTVTLAPEDRAAVSVVGPQALRGPSPSGVVLACALRPLGRPFTTPLPPGWLDFAVEVPAQPDALLLPYQVAPTETALVTDGDASTHADLVDRGRAAAAAIGLLPGGRLLTDFDPASTTGVSTTLLAPLVTDSSVVLALSASPERREHIATQERVTCRHWSSR